MYMLTPNTYPARIQEQAQKPRKKTWGGGGAYHICIYIYMVQYNIIYIYIYMYIYIWYTDVYVHNFVSAFRVFSRCKYLLVPQVRLDVQRQFPGPPGRRPRRDLEVRHGHRLSSMACPFLLPLFLPFLFFSFFFFFFCFFFCFFCPLLLFLFLLLGEGGLGLG